jgi:hypothetical protein
VTAQARESRQVQRQREQRNQGRSSTILTSPQGAQGSAMTRSRSLLGGV